MLEFSFVRPSVLALLIALPAAARAQGTVEGSVTAAAGTPLSDVVVRVEGARVGGISDEQGRFRLQLPAGRYALVAQRVGYATASDSVVVADGATATVRLVMREAAVVVAPVVVSATREAQKRTESSVTIDALSGADVRAARASHPAGLLNRVAGVHVSDLSGEGHSMAIRQPITTKPMYLYLEDGIPTRATGFFNHNALYEVNIPQSGGVEVMKGPGTALYGSDAIGGVVNVLTRPAPATPTAEVSLEGGEHGYSRALASAGFMRGTNGVRADLNVTRADNWKDDAPFHRTSGTVRWDAYDVHGWSARTVLTGSDIHQNDVPPLSTAQFAGDRTLNRAPIAYRTVGALRLSSAIERDRGASLWSVTPYARYNTMGLLPSWQLTFDPQTWDTKNTSLGMLLKYRRDFVPLRARVILGADADWSPGSFVARKAVTSAAGANKVYASYTTGETQYDYAVTYRAASPYVHAEASPTARLRVDAGLRADLAGYAYDTRLAPTDTGAHRRPRDTTVSYTHLSPKLGATYAVAPWLNAYGSYRHGFRAPSQSQLFQQNSAANTVGLAPVTVNSAELGLRGEVGRRMVYQLAAYDMRIHDDIITFITEDNRRVATNAGETRHRGVEGSVGAALTHALRLDASYSVASQKYVRWTPQAARPASGGSNAVAAVDYSGKLIEQAPRDLASGLLTWSPSLLKGGRVAVEWSHTGRYAMDPANTHTYGGYDLLAVQANAQVSPSVELFARGTNLTNRAYAELAAYDAFQKEQLTPGAPRTVYAGLRYEWQRRAASRAATPTKETK